MYVLAVIWTIAPFNNYPVLYNSQTKCLQAAAPKGNTLGDLPTHCKCHLSAAAKMIDHDTAKDGYWRVSGDRQSMRDPTLP
jgi:hypothetical protein